MARNCGKHYKCVPKEQFTPLQADTLGILAGIITLAGIFIPTWGIAGGILLMMAVWDLCRFLHGGKLVCLKQSVCVIGKIKELIPVGADKSGFDKMDDDFTFNILLSPHGETESRNDIISSDTVQGKFVDEHQNSKDLGLGFMQEKHYENLFHCEVKGCRVHDVCIALKIMAVVGAAVTTFCAFTAAAGPWGWLACAIALLIWAALTAIVGGITWATTHTGDLADVLDPASGQVSINDIVLVRGDWVYDAGHEGWNEIQPVRFVQKITIDPKFTTEGKADPTLVAEFQKEVLQVHCNLAGEADTEQTKNELKKAINRWHVHPAIDGCLDQPIIK